MPTSIKVPVARSQASPYGAATVTSAWIPVPFGTRVITVQNKVHAAPGGGSPIMATYVKESVDRVDANARTIHQWSNINSASINQNSYPVAAANQYATGVPAAYVSMPFIQIVLTFGGTTPTFDAEVTVTFI